MVEEPKLVDVAHDLATTIAEITPWLEPALLMITNDKWDSKRRIDVLNATGRFMVSDYATSGRITKSVDAAYTEKVAIDALSIFVTAYARMLAIKNTKNESR